MSANAHLPAVRSSRGLSALAVITLLAGLFGAATPRSRAELFGSIAVSGDSPDVVVEFTANVESYYHVMTTESLDNPWNVSGMKLGTPGPASWTDPGALRSCDRRFYRLLQIPRAQPRDEDEDGMNDVYELEHAEHDPLDAADAAEDPDSDGLENLPECAWTTDPANPDSDGDQVSDGREVNERGTDPLDAGSCAITLYASSVYGDDAFDGLTPLPENGHGPKHSVAEAIAVALSGDTVDIGAGEYTLVSVDTQGKAITLKPNGSVTILTSLQ